MPETVKKLNLIQGINVDTVSSDIKAWGGPSPHLKNNGIERDGGLTNIYRASESNSHYDEIFYCKNGGKVGLKYDSINDFYRCYSNGKEVCQVPPWGVKTKDAVRAQAEDAVATIDGKILTVRTLNGKAIIEEYDPEVSWIPTRTKEITLDATILQSYFVRRKDQTFDTTDAIVGMYYYSSTYYYPKLFTSGGLLYARTSGGGSWVFNQLFAWYENGYIIASNSPRESPATGYAVTLKSDGSGAANTGMRLITARINRTTGAVSFFATRDYGTSTSTTIGNTFTPPAAPGGSWTITPVVNEASSANTVNYCCVGGVIRALTAAGPLYDLVWTDGIIVKTWTVNHVTPTEFFGLVDYGEDDSIFFKQHTILYEGAYLSASWNEYSNGVPITEIGEIEPYYTPSILKQTDSGDYILVYKKYDQTFGYVSFSKTIYKRMVGVSGEIVKVNTIYAGNIIDTALNKGGWGSSAFNGFVVTAAVGSGGGAYTAQYAARHSNNYGNSVDTGEKTITGLSNDDGYCTPIEFVENEMFGQISEVIDIYYVNDYAESIGRENTRYIKPNLYGTLYVEDNRIPAPLGTETTDLLFLLVDKIAIREANYDGYQLANEIQGSYDAFELFGSIYLFDGDKINILTLASGVVSSVDFVAKATGLTLLASAPTMAYFLSGFDNSLFSFDGGRAVNKMGRFNQKAAIAEAHFHPKENTLLLVTSDSLIWIRDGIVTENPLPYVGTFLVYVTESGFIFAQGGAATQYLYQQIDVIEETIDCGDFDDTVTDTIDCGAFTDASFDEIIECGTFDQEGMVMPFEWESAYLGMADNSKQVISRYALRFYSPGGEQITVNLKYQAFDQETRWTETAEFTIGDTANPWDDEGYAYISFRPAASKSLAASIGVSYGAKLVTFEAYAYIDQVERAINKNQK